MAHIKFGSGQKTIPTDYNGGGSSLPYAGYDLVVVWDETEWAGTLLKGRYQDLVSKYNNGDIINPLIMITHINGAEDTKQQRLAYSCSFNFTPYELLECYGVYSDGQGSFDFGINSSNEIIDMS